MQAEITTTNMEEATVIRASKLAAVAVIKKPCSPKALFVFPDTPEVRDLLDRYHRRELLPIPARTLLITRADLYREARAARGGL